MRKKAIDLLASRFGLVWFMEQFDEGLILMQQWLDTREFNAEYRRENQLKAKRRPHDVARQHSDLNYLDSDRVRTQLRDVSAEDQKVYDFVRSTIYPRQVKHSRGDLVQDTRDLQVRNARNAALAEPASSRFMRNYIYKPLLHCHAV